MDDNVVPVYICFADDIQQVNRMSLFTTSLEIEGRTKHLNRDVVNGVEQEKI